MTPSFDRRRPAVLHTAHGRVTAQRVVLATNAFAGEWDITPKHLSEPIDPAQLGHDLGELREVVEAYSERLLIGEIYLPVDRLVEYYGDSNDGLHLPFNFQLLQSPWQAEVIRELIGELNDLLRDIDVAAEVSASLQSARIDLERTNLRAPIELDVMDTPWAATADGTTLGAPRVAGGTASQPASLPTRPGRARIRMRRTPPLRRRTPPPLDPPDGIPEARIPGATH